MTVSVSYIKIGNYQCTLLLSSSLLYSLLEQVVLLYPTAFLILSYQNLSKFNMSAQWNESVQMRESCLSRCIYEVLSPTMSKYCVLSMHVFLFIASF